MNLTNIGYSVWDRVMGSIWYSVRIPVTDSVRDSIYYSVVGSIQHPIQDSVEDHMFKLRNQYESN